MQRRVSLRVFGINLNPQFWAQKWVPNVTHTLSLKNWNKRRMIPVPFCREGALRRSRCPLLRLDEEQSDWAYLVYECRLHCPTRLWQSVLSFKQYMAFRYLNGDTVYLGSILWCGVEQRRLASRVLDGGIRTRTQKSLDCVWVPNANSNHQRSPTSIVFHIHVDIPLMVWVPLSLTQILIKSVQPVGSRWCAHVCHSLRILVTSRAKEPKSQHIGLTGPMEQSSTVLVLGLQKALWMSWCFHLRLEPA